MTKLLSSGEEATASPGDPPGPPSSFTSLPGLGTDARRVFVKKGANNLYDIFYFQMFELYLILYIYFAFL